MWGNQGMTYLRDYVPLIDRNENHVVQVGIGRRARGALAGAEEVRLGECSDLRDRLKVKMNTCGGNGRHRISGAEPEQPRGVVNQGLQRRLPSAGARGSPRYAGQAQGRRGSRPLERRRRRGRLGRGRGRGAADGGGDGLGTPYMDTCPLLCPVMVLMSAERA